MSSPAPDLPTLLTGWPQGYPVARLVYEYMRGRMTGSLDVTGRPATSVTESELSGLRVRTLVIDDPECAVAVASLGIPTFLYCDSVAQAARVPGAARDVHTLERVFDSGVERVIIAAPKSRAGLREYLTRVAELGSATAEVIVAGRDKHLPHGLRQDLEQACESVDMSPGAHKSRLFVGRISAAGRGWEFPQVATRSAGAHSFEVFAHGMCFGATAVDAGSQLLYDAVVARAGQYVPDAVNATVLDLGCGNGWLLTGLALTLGAGRAVATDVSRAAATSAALTLEAARVCGTRVRVHVGDAGAGLESAHADLVVLNPPFHDGSAVTTQAAHRMIDSAYRLVKPGGWGIVVFNSHLRYRGHINHVFGNSEQIGRNRRFTVVAAQK